MKPIKFQELYWRKNKLVSFFYLLALAFIVPNMFDTWDFLGAETVKYLTAFFSIGMLINGVRQFTHKHYVQWNKRGITIRVNSFLGVNFSFSEVRNITYGEDAITIYKFDGKYPKTINLKEVEEESKDRLQGLLRQYIR